MKPQPTLLSVAALAKECTRMPTAPYYDEAGVTLYQGDARALPLADESVQTCVTSPPYWGLRDYGVAGQLGLEPTPAEYVANMVVVFREVRRVLRPDGTLWLNLGDSYAASPGQATRGGPPSSSSTLEGNGHRGGGPKLATLSRVGKSGNKGNAAADGLRRSFSEGLKPKDLIGIPWRVAFALQADGWWLRQDIIWHKPNPMPESIRDRCTKAHEYLFLLAKSEHYYFDSKAFAEPCVSDHDSGNGFAGRQGGAAHLPMSGGEGTSEPWRRKQRKPAGWDTGSGAHGAFHRDGRAQDVEYTETEADTRNRRSVWTVTTNPYPGAHFATFPPELIEPCILAGSKPGDLVLDSFNGSGTTGEVAQKWGRRYVGVDLSADYLELSKRRFRQGVLWSA